MSDLGQEKDPKIVIQLIFDIVLVVSSSVCRFVKKKVKDLTLLIAIQICCSYGHRGPGKVDEPAVEH